MLGVKMELLMRSLVTLVLMGMLMCLSSSLASFSRLRCAHCRQMFYCNCSKQNLMRIPAVPSKFVTKLDISFNNLWKVMKDDFVGYGSLQYLIMTNNRIKDIHKDAFRPLANLKKLDISVNKLDTLSTKWFDNLPSLQHLNLLGNEYKTLGHGNVFQPLKRLRTLQLGGPLLQCITGRHISSLTGLQQLVVHAQNLQTYTKGSLGRSAPISRVSLALGGLFETNPALVEVLVSDVANPNTILTFTDTKFDTASHMIPFRAVKKGGTTNLIFKIIGMTAEACAAILIQLAFSNVSMIAIEDGKILLTQVGLGDLVSKVRLNNLDKIILKNLDVPQFYNFPAFFPLQSLLKVLHGLSVINCSVFAIPCESTLYFSNLIYLDVSENYITDFRFDDMMCSGKNALRNLETLNISRNYLQLINTQHLSHLNYLKNIDLSGNKFHVMPKKCNWPRNLKRLNLSSTRLTAVTSCLPQSLWVLDLSQNDLTAFNIELPFLQELYIAGNKLSALPDGTLYPYLTVLSIENNNLPSFSSDDLDRYARLRILEAGANLYICSCEFVAFMGVDLMRHRVTLGDSQKSYICESPDSERGKDVASARLSSFQCHRALVLSLLCLGVVATFLLIVGLCHNFNVIWYMRMTLAWLRAKKNPVLKQGELEYDAFISFSDMDSGWVEAHLIPELEHKEPPLRLCLHKRDFLPGGWILDNIIGAIERSHRTLFVLSLHFVRSEWCKYELDYSHFRLLDRNTDSAVLILLEPIDKETIPKRFCRLRRVMNSRTYLEWPDDDALLPQFWQSLRAALKRPED